MLRDKEIREPLFDFLEETYGKIRILEEKRMGKSRADLVMVSPEALYGIEIKSDADTYARLEGQVKDYDRFFDYNYVVVGVSHALHIRDHVPEWWGVITAEKIENGVDFYVMRKPSKNPKMKMKNKITLLWRPELAHIQELNQMPKYERQSKKFVTEKILLKVPEELLHLQISEELFERDYNEIMDKINQFRTERGMRARRRKRKYRRKGRAN